MKKLLYSVAALALLAGCAKDVNEIAPVVNEKGGLTLNLTVVEDDTRAVFDGDSHIAWEAKDKIGILATTTADATQAENNFAYGSLTLVDEKAEKPVFNGTVEFDNNVGETVYLAGLYPYSAISSTSTRNLTGVEINLAGTQKPSQASWDGTADVMLMKQVAVTASSYEEGVRIRDDYGDIYYVNRWMADAEIEFAHIFGFGCITFGSLPEGIGNEKVGSIDIIATGEAQNIAGKFKVDLNKDVLSSDFAIADSAPVKSISIVCDGTVALKDIKAWFVANPGIYDIKIDVATNAHKLSFERKGLTIERSKIAKPVVNFKDGDVSESTDVDLTGGKLWQHDTDTSYKADGEKYFFSKDASTVAWGTNEGVKTMKYTLAYSESEGNYGKYYNYSDRNGAVQKIANSSVRSGNVTITSAASYKGIEGIKVNTGNHYTYELNKFSYNVSAYIVDNSGAEYQLGEAQNVINDGDVNGCDLYFEPGSDTPSEGVVKIVFDGFNDTYYSSSYTYIGQLSINPEPGIKFALPVLELGHEACSGTTDVSVVCAKEAATVSTDVDWLKATINNGVISYTAEANTLAEKRVGHIIVSAKGNGEASKSLDVEQFFAIDLTGGKLWQHDTHTASNGGNSEGRFFTKNNYVATWGTLEAMPKVEFKLYCESNGTSATTVTPSSAKVEDIYVQKLQASNFRTGKIILESKSIFKGVNNIHVHGGMSSGTETCDIEAYVVSADGTKTQIGETQTLGGSPANPAGADFYFNAADAPTEGKVQIVLSNSSSSSCWNLYVSELDVNPAPNIVFGEKIVALNGQASTETVGVSIACATGEAKVTSDAEWLHIDSYKDGIITYSVDTNDSDDIRFGHIIVEATGNSTAQKELTVSQRSANSIEFKLTFGQAEIHDAIEKAKEAAEAAGESVVVGTAMSFTTTLKAVAADGSEATKDVELSFTGIEYGTVNKDHIVMLNNKGSFQNLTTLTTITNVSIASSNYSAAGYYYMYVGPTKESTENKEHLVDLSRTGSDYPKYIWAGTVPEVEKYGFFRCINNYEVKIYSVEISFLASNK